MKPNSRQYIRWFGIQLWRSPGWFTIHWKFVPQDLWVGAYWKKHRGTFELWVCLLPCLPIYFHCGIHRKPTKEAMDIWFNLPTVRNGQTPEHKPREFTCCDCPCVKDCEYSFDLYNLGGDCLALK